MDLKDWTGRQETADDIATAAPYAALAATLDRDASRPPHGTPLPALWHWLYFLPVDRRSALAHDGHAKRGGFLPPVALPRRMWAGSRMDFHAPVAIGDPLQRVSTIESVDEKIGRSGALVFVTVRHDISANGRKAITERHDIVYREAPRPGDSGAATAPAPASARWEKSWRADEVMLFRYSALTFNGHRIHYDREYATREEGYPGLVVHGPLVATLLLDLLRDHRPEAIVTGFRFRALSALFDRAAFTVCGEPQADGTTYRLWAKGPDGRLAMDATATTA